MYCNLYGMRMDNDITKKTPLREADRKQWTGTTAPSPENLCAKNVSSVNLFT